jgi:hypothetical protein
MKLLKKIVLLALILLIGCNKHLMLYKSYEYKSERDRQVFENKEDFRRWASRSNSVLNFIDTVTISGKKYVIMLY